MLYMCYSLFCKVLPIFLWFQFHFTIITQDVTKKVSLKCETLGVVCIWV